MGSFHFAPSKGCRVLFLLPGAILPAVLMVEVVVLLVAAAGVVWRVGGCLCDF